MKRIFFARIIIGSLFATVAAGTWDAWWHGALGRESFWSPPHLLMYSSVLVAIFVGWRAWYIFRDKLWRRSALVLSLIPLSAPIDDLWHRLFGVENIASPAIIWSPPHLLLIFGIIGTIAMILPILKQDEDRDAGRLFGSMSFGMILALLFFVAAPFEPIGPYHILGFWGAGIFAALLAGVFLLAGRWLPGLGGVTITATFFLLLSAIGFGEKISPNVIIEAHEHAPNWLTIFSVLAPASLLDLSKRLPPWTKGGVVGFLWALLFYGVASYFFDPQFQYSISQAVIAIIAGTIGGVLGSSIVYLKYPNR